MSPRRSRARLSPMLEAVIEAVEHQQIDNAAGAARALRAFGEIALVEVPCHGMSATDRPELFKAVEEIADKHLGFSAPRRRFYDATGEVADSELRERIQDAAGELQVISDQAYFYVGLSFGVTLARLGWPW